MNRKELEKLTKSQLLSIASYYNIEVSQKEKKNEIIDKIIALFPLPVVEEQVEMSVRIKRIKEQNNA